MSKKQKRINNDSDIDDTLIEELDTDDIIDNDYIDDTEINDDLLQQDDEEQTDCILDKMVEEDTEYNDIDDTIENSNDLNNIIVKKENRISSNRLTKYEMVRILGERIKQLTMGAKPMIKNHESLSYEQMAEEELKINMIPFKIKRPLPNGKYEIWTLDELNKEHLLSFLDE